MNQSEVNDYWEVSRNAEEVHTLLCASDAYHATQDAPAPSRNLITTERYTAEGNVFMLRCNNKPAGMFTLTKQPPFTVDETIFPTLENPIYICRLAVLPELIQNESITGARCLRKAIELGRTLGADGIRSEANPDLSRTWELLQLFGFREYKRMQSSERIRRCYLQKSF